MQINNNPIINQLFSFLTGVNPQKLNDNQPVSQTQPTNKQSALNINVRNMSPNELQHLINELRDSGQISEKDSTMLTVGRMNMEQYNGKDTKMDMIGFYKNQINIMKSTHNAKGVEIMERSLAILNAVEARTNANIPESV